MTCVICKHGIPQPGTTTVTVERPGTLVVFRQVPAQICPDCGERYLDAEVVETMSTVAEAAAATGTEVDVRVYRPIQA
ncbi:MAG: type II toxin-antitoxin system MqsA family antitoxin [Firmicutes bacterium]|nr:type II toxin-antitoxin system MqsA family antitoxin [Bacillota bacterium]